MNNNYNDVTLSREDIGFLLAIFLPSLFRSKYTKNFSTNLLRCIRIPIIREKHAGIIMEETDYER